ncbi:MAG: ribbon-helix-helix protein, CopG family [Desulfatitalea sp.]
MSTNTISARLDEATHHRLALLAQATKRSKSYLVSEAVQEYVRAQEWQIAAIREGLEAAQNNDFATEEEVRVFYKSWGIDEA